MSDVAEVIPIDAGGLPLAVRRSLEILSAEIHQLVGEVDSAVIPRPDRHETLMSAPGVMWEPAKGWNVQAPVPEDDGTLCVFMSTPDHWGGDVACLNVTEARKLGLALIASVAWMERHFDPRVSPNPTTPTSNEETR